MLNPDGWPVLVIFLVGCIVCFIPYLGFRQIFRKIVHRPKKTGSLKRVINNFTSLFFCLLLVLSANY